MGSRAYDAAPVGLCYLDRTFRYCEINDWLARINGVSVEKHLGRTLYEVVPDVAQGIVEQLDRVAETREPLLNGRVVARTPAHPTEERTYEHNFLPDIGSGNIVLGFNIVVWDVTERLADDNRQALSAARKVNDLRPWEAYAQLESQKYRLEEENLSPRASATEAAEDSELVGRSHALQRVHLQVEQVAPTDATVLLLGETGTGKGLIARSIHDRSKRSEGPFVTVNCAALPESLLESELFGHEKGAFTGAVSQKLGRFETADGGTVFLDEIGEMPMHLQVKLLRFLHDLEFERIGSSQTRKVDTRVIAATNRNLDEMIEQGRFRSDLYFRIGVFPIQMPPLRERRSDIPLLVWYFVAALQGRIGKRIEQISDREMRILESHSWPGNIRELQNLVERAMILSSGPRLALEGLLPSRPVLSRASPRVCSSLEEVEREHIVGVLEECGWRIRGNGGAADRLGLKRTTLQSRMKKLGIVRPHA